MSRRLGGTPRRSKRLAAVIAGLTTIAIIGGASVAMATEPTPPPTGPLDQALAQVPGLPPLSDDDFYQPPARTEGDVGDIIRSRSIVAPAFPEATTQQFMYVSKNQKGDAVPVTGTLLTSSTAPKKDAPLVVVTPGTRGLGKQCAPSKQFNLATLDPRAADYESATYTQYLLRGINVVVTDYVGGGTPLPQEYLVGRSEGQNGLDAVRAAQRLNPDDAITDASPVGVSGYSQGGQAAGWVQELQPDYAPEINLKGAIIDAPVQDMVAQIEHLNGNPTAGAGFGLAGMQGTSDAFGLDIRDYLTDTGKKVYERLNASCTVEDIAGFGTITTADVTDPDVLQQPQFRDALKESLLGTKKPGAPAYIYHGSADTIVPANFGPALFSGWCQQGADVEFTQLPAQEHLSGNITGTPAAIDWMAKRLAGEPPRSGCVRGSQIPVT
ncbi:lipase family protein [Pseudonocardia tropica]|uniref:Lipase family protein n=1 Tax=Pseudonocardia tropica TaxID=681289 RepID=A0ABV1JXT1_9PSEU